MKGVTLPSSAVTCLVQGGLGPAAGGTEGWPHMMELYVSSEPVGQGRRGGWGVARYGIACSNAGGSW